MSNNKLHAADDDNDGDINNERQDGSDRNVTFVEQNRTHSLFSP